MKPTLEYVAAALTEAEAATRWYVERSAPAARRFSEELDAYPFSMVYRIEPERILIVAVMHFRRRPAYWLRRKSPG